MKARPLIYVSDLDRSLKFYELLGLRQAGRRRGNLVEVRGDNITFALHRTSELPEAQAKARVLLTFEADRPIDALSEDLHGAGVDFDREVTDEAYGYSIAIRDPDGLLIQINQHDTM